jgi:prevent-host-death family protein
MSDIVVSVAEFKAHLSRLLSESRANKKPIIILNRKKPIATVLPYEDTTKDASASACGLASLAGGWPGWEEISPEVERVYASRQKEDFREVSF